MSPGPREAMTVPQYDEWDRTGKMPKQKKTKNVVQGPDPQEPKIEDKISLKSIPIDQITDVSQPQLKAIRNAEGVMFTGYRLTIQMGDKSVSGWMNEKDFRAFQVELRDKKGLPFLHSLTVFGDNG